MLAAKVKTLYSSLLLQPLKFTTMKKQIENEALNLFNECCKLGLYVSYRCVLNTMYETASEGKKHLKCSIISELIAEDINS